jgi:SPP1 family predicted phage head-tail adaptor
MINPGELRHSVQLQAPSSTRDASGEPIATWSAVLTTRAKIEGTSSAAFKDSFSNSTLAAESTDLLTIRWPGSSITVEPGQRVIFGDVTYLIQDVDNVQRRNRKLRLACVVVDERSN